MMTIRLLLTFAFGALFSSAAADTLNVDLDDVNQWKPIEADTAEFARLPWKAEKIMGQPDFVKVSALPPDDPNRALSRMVGQFLDLEGGFLCSGSLIGPDLFLTNHHCVSRQGKLIPAKNIGIAMEHMGDDDIGPPESLSRVQAILAADENLDFALLRLTQPLGERYGWLNLERNDHVIGQQRAVKIIQHPAGRSKEIVTRNTQTLNCPSPMTDVYYCYLADTEGGSSGSPVFAQDGSTIIALHRAGIEGKTNIGTRISYVAARIGEYLPVTGAGARRAAAATTTSSPTTGAAPTVAAPATRQPAARQPAAQQPAQQPAVTAQPPTEEPPKTDDGGWQPVTD